MKKMKLIRYSDRQHSWFKIPRSLLKKLNIIDKISPCSKQYGDFVYLEEDCDITVFFEANFKTKEINLELIRQNFNIITKHASKSKVRQYRSYDSQFVPFVWEINKRVSLYGKNYRTMERYGEKTLLSDDGIIYSLKKCQIHEIKSLDGESVDLSSNPVN